MEFTDLKTQYRALQGEIDARMRHMLHGRVFAVVLQRAVLGLEIGEFHQAADFRCTASRARHSSIGAMPAARSLLLSSTE